MIRTFYSPFPNVLIFSLRVPIDTIPQAMWWAITTVTTVGYGDAIPLSFGGKFLSLFALLFGVIVPLISMLIFLTLNSLYHFL